MRSGIGQVLLDFDGVLAHYQRQQRVAWLAAYAGVDHDRVFQVLYGSGLEAAHDAGQLDAQAYLHALGQGIGRAVDVSAWQAARLAGTGPNLHALQRVADLAPALELAILTNNGVLIVPVISQVLGAVQARVQGRVLCSGQFGLRKPAVEVYRRALDHLGWAAQSTLFVDDLFVNVQGARAAGLHADSVRDARALGRVFKRYGLSSGTVTSR